MERKEAVDVLRTILDRCSTENVTKVMIMPSSSDNAYSTGSQIYIEAPFDPEAKKYLQTIAEQYHLSIKENANTVIIYKPLQGSKT